MPKPKPELDKSLPHNAEAERNVLGAVLLDNSAFPVVLERVQAEDFFFPQNSRIFAKMIELHKKQIPIDVIMLMEELERTGELEAAGDIGYLSQLTDGIPRISNVEHYARIVKEKSVLRSVAWIAEAIKEQALSATIAPNEVLDRAKVGLGRLSEQAVKGGLIQIKAIINESYSHLEKMWSEMGAINGLSTGYSDLDYLLGGLQPAELIILAARPSFGKTSFALNLIENVAVRKKQPIGMFSLEMSREALLIRLLASHVRIDAHKFRTGHFTREDSEKLLYGLAELSDAPLWIDDSASASISEMEARAQRMKQEHGLALLCVDYIQLVAPSDGRSSRQEKVSEISRGLKMIAKTLNVPVIALSQLSRAMEKEKRRPVLSDLRESGGLEQDADVVMFIHRPNFYKMDMPEEDRAKAELIVAKQRNGPVGTLNFYFMSRYTRFEEAAPDSWDSDLGASK